VEKPVIISTMNIKSQHFKSYGINMLHIPRMHVYIYIYIEREREREIKKELLFKEKNMA
jgi:hypothetical protein